MDLLETPPAARAPLPLAVAVALAGLGVAQALALTSEFPLPDDVALDVPLEGYAFATESDPAVVTFQLRNAGSRLVRVTGVGAEVPGLQLVDVSAAGEPTGFRAVGAGPAALPDFDLAPGAVVVLHLSLRGLSCEEVPADLRPVSVDLRTGRRVGSVQVPLPSLPDDGALADPDDETPWQRVLVRDLCG